MRARKLKIGFAVAIGCSAALLVSSLAAGAGATSPAAVGSAKAGLAKCGLGNGKKATGSPIKIGGIDMLIPGVDFTTMGKVAKAYFDCVNDNGGINGRPVKYTPYKQHPNPPPEPPPPPQP